MKKQEFKRIIGVARELLAGGNYTNRSTCNAITKAQMGGKWEDRHRSTITTSFCELMSPVGMGSGDQWFRWNDVDQWFRWNDVSDELSEERNGLLSLFEQICLTEKLYKEF